MDDKITFAHKKAAAKQEKSSGKKVQFKVTIFLANKGLLD